MLDWSQRNLERVVERVQFGLISRGNPEMRRLIEGRDRRWLLWFALNDAPPWQRVAHAVMILGIGPSLSLALLRLMTSNLPRSARPDGWLVVMLAVVAGALTMAMAVELVRGPRIRQRLFRAMRILGHDVCPGCGYHMVGHEPTIIRRRRCPECGGDVPVRNRWAA